MNLVTYDKSQAYASALPKNGKRIACLHALAELTNHTACIRTPKEWKQNHMPACFGRSHVCFLHVNPTQKTHLLSNFPPTNQNLNVSERSRQNCRQTVFNNYFLLLRIEKTKNIFRVCFYFLCFFVFLKFIFLKIIIKILFFVFSLFFYHSKNILIFVLSIFFNLIIFCIFTKVSFIQLP